MSTNTYTDPVLTTELREWVQNDTEVYVPNECILPPWNKGLTNIYTPEQLKRISRQGMKHSPETKEKMSKSQTGRIHSAKTRKKMSENNVGMRGKKHSPESLKKMRESQTGKIQSEETKRKISEARKKYWANRRGV